MCFRRVPHTLSIIALVAMPCSLESPEFWIWIFTDSLGRGPNFLQATGLRIGTDSLQLSFASQVPPLYDVRAPRASIHESEVPHFDCMVKLAEL